MSISDELQQMVSAGTDPEKILVWLLGQGLNEIDARRMLQYQMERVA